MKVQTTNGFAYQIMQANTGTKIDNRIYRGKLWQLIDQLDMQVGDDVEKIKMMKNKYFKVVELCKAAAINPSKDCRKDIVYIITLCISNSRSI